MQHAGVARRRRTTDARRSTLVGVRCSRSTTRAPPPTAGATEIVLRSLPAPPHAAASTRVPRARRASCARAGRRAAPPHADHRAPRGARSVQKWLDLGLPIVSGHLGLVAELARAGRDVVADYAVNCFNQHTAAELFRLGARRIDAVHRAHDRRDARRSSAPWEGAGFDVFVYGRPEGMTIEHCVLSAAFDRDADHLPRSLRAEAHERRSSPIPPATSSRSRPTRPAAIGCCTRARSTAASTCRGSGAHGIRGYHLVFNVAGRSGRRGRSCALPRAARRAGRRRARPRRRRGAHRGRARRSRAGTSRARSERTRRRAMPMIALGRAEASATGDAA